MDERITAVTITLALLDNEHGDLAAMQKLSAAYLVCTTLLNDYPRDRLFIVTAISDGRPNSPACVLAKLGIVGADVHAVAMLAEHPTEPDLAMYAFLTDELTGQKMRTALASSSFKAAETDKAAASDFAHIFAESVFGRCDSILTVAESLLAHSKLDDAVSDLLRNVPE